MQGSRANILKRASTEGEISQVSTGGRGGWWGGDCHYLGDAEHCEKMGMLMRAKYTENSCIVNELTPYARARMNL